MEGLDSSTIQCVSGDRAGVPDAAGGVGAAGGAGVSGFPGGQLFTLPLLTGRVNAQMAVSESVDWFGASGDFKDFMAVCSLCHEWWGACADGPGSRFFTKSVTWANGARVDYTEPGDGVKKSRNPGRFMLTLSGSVLGEIDGADRLDFLYKFYLAGACRITRLDVALDFKGPSVEVVDRFIESSEPDCRELHGFKRRQSHIEYSGQRLVRKGVSLGLRGKNGRGVYVRVYDKALEQVVGASGTWDRVEVEYTGDCAREAFGRLVGADTWSLPGREVGCFSCTTIPRLICGALEFRTPLAAGQRARKVAELPRVAWWACFVEAVVGDVKRVDKIKAVAKSASNWTSYVRWYRSNILPSQARVAYAAGVTLEKAMALLGTMKPEPCYQRLLTPREYEQKRMLL